MSLHEEQGILNLLWYKTHISLLPGLNGMKVLEVGCHRSVFANYLSERCPQAQIVAFDFSESAIGIALQKVHFPILKLLFKPFGRHFTYCGQR